MNDNRLANLLGALALALSDAQMAAARDVAGMGPSACAALVTIGQNAGLTITGLSHVLGLTHSVTVRLVEGLAADGLVDRLQGTDKRQVALRLSARGRALQRSILKARSKVVAAALSAASPAERERLGDTVATMLDVLTTGRIKADHICRFCDEAVCPEESCPVELKAIRIEQAGR